MLISFLNNTARQMLSAATNLDSPDEGFIVAGLVTATAVAATVGPRVIRYCSNYLQQRETMRRLEDQSRFAERLAVVNRQFKGLMSRTNAAVKAEQNPELAALRRKIFDDQTPEQRKLQVNRQICPTSTEPSEPLIDPARDAAIEAAILARWEAAGHVSL